MTFTQACEVIRDIKHDYKIIRPTVFDVPYNFKFEFKGKRFDCFDVVYHHMKAIDMLPPHDDTQLSKRIKALNMSINDAVSLWQLCAGQMERRKDIHPMMKAEYEQRRNEFESITQIKVTND